MFEKYLSFPVCLPFKLNIEFAALVATLVATREGDVRFKIEEEAPTATACVLGSHPQCPIAGARIPSKSPWHTEQLISESSSSSPMYKNGSLWMHPLILLAVILLILNFAGQAQDFQQVVSTCGTRKYGHNSGSFVMSHCNICWTQKQHKFLPLPLVV